MPDVFSSQVGAVYEYSTRAEMASTSNASHAYRLAWCDETGGIHEFVPNDVSQPDGWVVIASTGTQSGNWLFRSEEFVVSPIGGGQDDWPTLVGSLMPAAAYKKRIKLNTGVWSAQTKQLIPSGTVLEGQPGVEIVQAYPVGTGDPFYSALSANYVLGTASTLASKPVRGSLTLSVTANIATVGGYLLVQESGQNFRWSIFTVMGVAGQGPYTVTVDRPILFDFKNGDAVTAVTPPIDIKIFGNGMRITGPGSRFLEFWGAQRCLVSDVTFDVAGGATSERLASFDVGSYASHYIRCTGDGGGTVPLGFSFESAEHCSAVDCTLTRIASVGYILQDNIDNEVRGCDAYGCNVGLAFIAAAGNTEGCLDCRVIGGNFSGNVGGIAFTQAATECKVIGSRVSNNTGDGVAFTGTDTMVGNRLIGCTIDENTANGINIGVSFCDGTQIVDCSVQKNQTGVTIASGATRTTISKLDVGGCTGYGINAAADYDADGIFGSLATTSTQAIQQTAGRASLRGVHITTPGNSVYSIYASGGSVDVDESAIVTGATAGALGAYANGAGSVIRLSRTKITQSGANAGAVAVNAGGQVFLGAGADIDSTTVPIQNFGGAGSAVMASRDGGLVSVPTTGGTTTFTIAQAKAGVTETSGLLQGNATINYPNILGLIQDVFNNNTGAFSTTFAVTGGAGFAVGQGKRASGYVDGSGNFVRVTPDT